MDGRRPRATTLILNAPGSLEVASQVLGHQLSAMLEQLLSMTDVIK
jgi:hypothetical protein